MHIKQSLLVPFTASNMFDLVNDIERYVEFLPWCRSATVHSRTEKEVKASIQVSKNGIEQSFTTLNRLQQDSLIEVSLLEGPFRRLEGYWQFNSLGDKGCKVEFNLELEFINHFISMTLTPILKGSVSAFVNAFLKRAKIVYG